MTSLHDRGVTAMPSHPGGPTVDLLSSFSSLLVILVTNVFFMLGFVAWFTV